MAGIVLMLCLLYYKNFEAWLYSLRSVKRIPGLTA